MQDETETVSSVERITKVVRVRAPIATEGEVVSS